MTVDLTLEQNSQLEQLKKRYRSASRAEAIRRAIEEGLKASNVHESLNKALDIIAKLTNSGKVK